MFSLRRALVFFLLSALFAAKYGRSYGHSLLQQTSPRSEFSCTLTPEELQPYSSGEGRWIVTNSTLQELDGDIQSLVNCVEEGDVLLFDVEEPVQPSRRIVISSNLTLSSLVEDPRLENGVFPESQRKATIFCPREDEGVFLVEATDSLFANFVFQNCSLNYTREDAVHGIVTTAGCSTGQDLGTIAFHHLEFEANSLNRSAALYIQEPFCAGIQIVDWKFQNNSCVGTCAAYLPSRSEIRNVTLTTNRIFEEDDEIPALIAIESGSSTTIDRLTASGNNGTILLAQNANLRINNCRMFQNSRTETQNRYYAAGITLLHSSGRIIDCQFERNAGVVGSAIAVHNSSVVISRTSVTGNNAATHGGGISLWHCPRVRILDSVITNNSAALNGSGIHSNWTRDLKIKGTAFVMNHADRGGGLYFTYGDLEITTSTFRNNTVSTNGAGLQFRNGNITMKDTTMMACRSGDDGGGGYMENSLYSLTNLTLVQNEAKNGGGIYLTDSSGSLNNSNVELNSVISYGGGAYIRRSNASIFHNCTFVNNSATYGGGTYGSKGTLASVISCHFLRNRVHTSGGGVRFRNGTYTIESSTFEENASDGFGGGLTCFRSRLNVSDTRFLRNHAEISGGGSNVYENTSAWFANCTWSDNVARRRGGGAVFGTGSSTTITDSSFRQNQAQLGGGVHAANASITMLNTRGNHNTVTRSGAVMYFRQTYFTLSNCSFHRNAATHGGVLACYDSVTEVSTSNFVSNEAALDGGTLHIEGSGVLTMEGCSFTSNSASRDGGTIFASDSIVSATNLRFQNNSASQFGGAVYLERGASASLSHSTFFNDSSNYRGGSISATETLLSVRNISISSCSAVYGGGVYLDRSLADIIAMSVTLCEASESGGAIRMIESNLTSIGLNISFNTAVETSRYRSAGGGIAIESSSNLTLRNTTLDGNKAQYGAGIYGIGESVVFISDGYFNNNSATTSGGAGYFASSSSTTMERILFAWNSAQYGGSIYITNSSLSLNGSLLNNSFSIDAGGSIMAEGGASVTIEETRFQSSRAANGGGIMLIGSYIRGVRVQFHNCSARVHGGGVGLNESSSILCTNCLFEGNSALYEGGALRLESLKPQLLAFQLANTVFRGNDADFGGAIHFQTGDGSADCSDVNSTYCTFLALTGCVFTNNHARSAGGAILANNPSAIRISCDPFNKIDPFGYYTREEFGTLREILSLDVVCDNWTRNDASTYGPIVGSYARRVSTSIMLGPNRTEEIPGNQYALRNHSSGDPLPTILLKAIDEFSQGPALIQDDQLIEAVMTSPDGLFAGIFIVRMEDSQGTFTGISGVQKPGEYNIYINFSERAMPRLIIAVEIRECLIGEWRVANGTLCEPCGADTYNFHPLSNEECTPCPEDAKCDLVAIRPKKGFWHQTPCSSHLQSCLSERACDEESRNTRLLALGSSIENCTFEEEFVSNYSEAMCREGYTGPLCGSCKDSHGKTRSFRCEECYDRLVSVCLVVLAASVLLALSAFTIRSALPVHKHPRNRTQSRLEEPTSSLPVNFRMVEMLCTRVVPPEVIHPHLRTQGRSDNTATAQQRDQRNAELAKWKATEIFKVTINYLQVIGVAVAVNVAWTGALITLFETAEFIGGVTSEAAGHSTDCLVSVESPIPRSETSTIVKLMIPAVVAAICAVFWTVIMITNQQGYSYLMKRCLLSAIVVSYLSYITVTKTAVNIFYCVEIYDSIELGHSSTTKYWAVNTALKCYDESHNVLAFMFGLPVLVLFSFGFPILVAYVLTTKRSQEGIQSPWLFETAGFFYRSYDNKFIFWESVILLRKATLAVIVVFAYPLGGNLQGILAVCVLVVALYFHTLCSPYRSEFEALNRLEGLSLLISSLTFASGLFFNDDRTSPEARSTIATFLILGNVGIFVYFCVRFFVAGATYLGIVLENEGVVFDQNATALHIVKIFLRNRFDLHLVPALRRFSAFAYRPPQESISPVV